MSKKINDFVRKFYPFAVESQKQTKIPAVFTLAQAALETGWGEKSEGNNLFGITANKYWKGETVLVKTWEFHDTPNVKYPEIESITFLEDKQKYKYIVRRYFRKYKSYTECFNDHNEFLLKPRYAKAFDHTDDAKAFANEVAKAGYATSLNYAKTLHRVIDRIQNTIDELDLDPDADIGTFGVVRSPKLNVRVAPAIDAPKVAELVKDQRVRVFEKREAWYKIRKGVAGWISNKFLNENGAVIANTLNVRAEPGGSLVGSLVQGNKPFTIVEDGEWNKISTEQWVSAKFIDIEIHDETPKTESIG
jgi:flagellar protein FlgJ